MPKVNESVVLLHLKSALPGLLGVWLFGSVAQNMARSESDIDLAVLTEGKADVTKLWQLAQDLAIQCGHDVDLLDLRTASTVMQYQIITSGRCLWAKDVTVGLFECFILSEKTALDAARGPLLEDIRQQGKVYK